MDIKKHSQKILVFIINALLVVVIALGIKEWSAKSNSSAENESSSASEEAVQLEAAATEKPSELVYPDSGSEEAAQSPQAANPVDSQSATANAPANSNTDSSSSVSVPASIGSSAPSTSSATAKTPSRKTKTS